jgi:hypothetical protein
MAPAALLVFLLSSLFAVFSAADGEGGDNNCSPMLCGNVSISFPFAIVPGEAIETSCGAIGFQVRCENNTPYLGYKNDLYGHQFQILDISYDNASLIIADVHKLHHFNGPASESCRTPSNNSSNKLGLPFSISPKNKNLIFYNCEKPLPEKVWRRDGLVETTCGNRTFIRVVAEPSADDSSGSYGSYFLEGCNATVVPAFVRSGAAANASNYKELISDGFLLTWQVTSLPPSPPSSSSGMLFTWWKKKCMRFIRKKLGTASVKRHLGVTPILY